ncbi:MAG: glycosyltransferase [Candidatus Amulumruptor caecigallinarius]|nr:glycosyltransferase [Candidatus Amulumruptor caecigallinarius]
MKSERLLFSIIVPVYNRPDEVADLLDSLRKQTDKGFEIILVEDGSTTPCMESEQIADGSWHPKGYKDLRIKYFKKANEGRSIARNHGIHRADGDYFVFVDSDCILPPQYIATLRDSLRKNPCDCFGGPDAAHESFSDLQKAINYSMTSFLTTGGIRGGKVSMEKFTPRTFNMGFSREVFERVGGFREMFSEDIDMSTRIRNAGFSITLYPEVFVYHKRRVDFRKFWKQVHVFGMSRITLELLYPGSMKLVHWLPAVFTVGVVALLAASFFNLWFILPLVMYVAALWLCGIIATKSLKIGTLGVGAAFVQLTGYGTGFLKAYFNKIILGKGRDIEREIEIRKGENEDQ